MFEPLLCALDCSGIDGWMFFVRRVIPDCADSHHRRQLIREFEREARGVEAKRKHGNVGGNRDRAGRTYGCERTDLGVRQPSLDLVERDPQRHLSAEVVDIELTPKA